MRRVEIDSWIDLFLSALMSIIRAYVTIAFSWLEGGEAWDERSKLSIDLIKCNNNKAIKTTLELEIFILRTFSTFHFCCGWHHIPLHSNCPCCSRCSSSCCGSCCFSCSSCSCCARCFSCCWSEAFVSCGHLWHLTILAARRFQVVSSLTLFFWRIIPSLNPCPSPLLLIDWLRVFDASQVLRLLSKRHRNGYEYLAHSSSLRNLALAPQVLVTEIRRRWLLTLMGNNSSKNLLAAMVMAFNRAAD